MGVKRGVKVGVKVGVKMGVIRGVKRGVKRETIGIMGVMRRGKKRGDTVEGVPRYSYA